MPQDLTDDKSTLDQVMAWCRQVKKLLPDGTFKPLGPVLFTQGHYTENVEAMSQWIRPWGDFKNTYVLLNLRALKFSHANKIDIFQCMGKIFCVEFQRYPLKRSTQNILPIHWKMWFLCNIEILRALRFKSSHAFLNPPPPPPPPRK